MPGANETPKSLLKELDGEHSDMEVDSELTSKGKIGAAIDENGNTTKCNDHSLSVMNSDDSSKRGDKPINSNSASVVNDDKSSSECKENLSDTPQKVSEDTSKKIYENSKRASSENKEEKLLKNAVASGLDKNSILPSELEPDSNAVKKNNVSVLDVHNQLQTDSCNSIMVDTSVGKKVNNKKVNFKSFTQELPCISINSQITFFYKDPSISVSCDSEGMTLGLPKYKASSQIYKKLLAKSDVEHGLVYCDKYSYCFISMITSSDLGEDIKQNLKTYKRKSPYYNPDAETTKQLKISFLMENVTGDIAAYLCSIYGKEKMRVINQKDAIRMLTSSYSNETTKAPPLLASTCLIYPAVDGIEVKTEDIALLAHSRHLNDTIIDFYLKYVYCEKLAPEIQNKIHIFSSFFYIRLKAAFGSKTSKPEWKTIGPRFHNETKNVDIFSKDFLFIPVNINRHWQLVVICFLNKLCKESADEVPLSDDSAENNEAPKKSKTDVESKRKTRKQTEAAHPFKEMPCVCFFDSSDSSSRLNCKKIEVATILREFFEMMWKNENPDKPCNWNKLLFLKARCPQQKNLHDCGIFILQYFESFFEKPIPYFQDPLPNLRDWFHPSIIKFKRGKIKNLISDLKREQGEISVPSHSSGSSDVMDLT